MSKKYPKRPRGKYSPSRIHLEFSDSIWDTVNEIYFKKNLLHPHMNRVFENAIISELKNYGIHDARYCCICETVLTSEDFYTPNHAYCKKCMTHKNSKLFGGHWEEVVKSTDAKCVLCGDWYEHVHHVIPRINGGSDEFNNLVPLCSKCHHEAHSKYISKEFKINIKTLLELQSMGYAQSFTTLISNLSSQATMSTEVI